MRDYNSLPFLPEIIAETVCATVYEGREVHNLSPADIAATESARQAMTPSDITTFAKSCDQRCRNAFHAKANWFMKCIRAKGNRGRDQLYLWTAHWLASYLKGAK